MTLLFITSFFLVGCDKKSPEWEYFPDMYDSPAREAQEFDETAPNKVGGRLPVEGTIPLEHTPYEFKGPNLDDQKVKDLKIPGEIKLTAANLKRGETQFQIFCYPCHGPQGEGNGPVIGPPGGGKFNYSPNMNIHGTYAYLNDGQIYHVITNGNGQMPAYASMISEDDRWKIVLYVRKLKETYELLAQAKTVPAGNTEPNKDGN
ncbi:MAG: cytochrome c [Spirochaetia bacterium]|nr:cytochrome c [Spirochaetia bacterium]